MNRSEIIEEAKMRKETDALFAAALNTNKAVYNEMLGAMKAFGKYYNEELAKEELNKKRKADEMDNNAVEETQIVASAETAEGNEDVMIDDMDL